MKPRAFALVLFLLAAANARASCGTSSCPLDLNALNAPLPHRFSLDLSLQYIDQDQPRIGSREARVGEIPGGHHDEVRTINRITTATLTYAFSERLHVNASVPWVSRAHRHLASSHSDIGTQHHVVPEGWDIHGIGDASLTLRAAVRPRLWLIGGVKLATGAQDLRNADGETGELPIQPGTGTTDGIAGFAYEGRLASTPYFVSATYQFRGSRDDYRVGNELQLNAGTSHPMGGNLEALLQLNARFRQRDRAADPDEAQLTGGRYVYASPGVRVSYGGSAIYALVQLPIIQKVNAIQLTADVNYVAGVQKRF